jgi:hypothetical protein
MRKSGTMIKVLIGGLLLAFVFALQADDKEKEKDKKKGGAAKSAQHEPHEKASTKKDNVPRGGSAGTTQGTNEAPHARPQVTNPGTTPSPASNTYGNRTPGTTPSPAPNTYSNRTPGTNTGTPPAGNSGFRNMGSGNRPNAPNSPNVRTPGGPGNVTRYPNGKVQVYHGPNNTTAQFHANGRVAVIQRPGMTIVHSSAGPRQVIVERPDHTVIVARGAGIGYVQRPFMFHNQPFVQRTIIVGRVPVVQVYRPWVFGRVTFNLYAPVRFYSPGFYVWAYTPWRVPVRYRWGLWIGTPWFGFYGGFFAPAPVYYGPNMWLADYMMAATLQAAYQERMAAQAQAQAYPPPGAQTPLSPEARQAIADEVQRQLALERNGAQSGMVAPTSGLPPELGGGPHVFVVAHSMDVPDVMAGGQECLLTEGDVLQLSGPPSMDQSAANVAVLASKGFGCRKGTMVTVQMQDLVEMQNQMRATIDQGMQQLQSSQGQGGLPALPASANTPPVQAPFAAAVPPADPNAVNAINQQAQAANQVEQEVTTQASAADAGAPAQATAPPATISLGQTMDQVQAMLGDPKQIVDLGSKKIYVYANMKVIFIDGKVSDVQ